MRLSRLLPILFTFGVAFPCSAALYTPLSTVLDAQTGKTSWEGPNDYEDFGSATGALSASSTFTYFSGWSSSDVTASANSNANLTNNLIALSVANSTNGYDYNFTQADASAAVSFYLPLSGTFTLNESGDVGSLQTSLSLTGPGGWSWAGPVGAAVVAPAGEYTFSLDAFVQRGGGVDLSSNLSASLQLGPAGAATVPEPSDFLILAVAPMLWMKRRPR